MFLIFGTIYNSSNVVAMEIVPKQSIADQIIDQLSNDKDLKAIHWHIHPVIYSQEANQGVENIKSRLRSINQNRFPNHQQRTQVLMPNEEKQMLNKFSKRHNNK